MRKRRNKCKTLFAFCFNILTSQVMGSTCSLMNSDEKADTVSIPRRSTTTIHDSTDNTILTSFCLTFDETNIIKETWHNIKDKNEFAVALFLRIFKIAPEVAEVFELNDYHTSDSLRTAPRFIGHAANFSAFLNMIINHINGNETVAIKVSKVIGREHVRLTKHRHFEPKFWETFLEALLIEMENEQKGKNQKYIEAVLSAWADLFGKVIEIMEISYNKEKSLKL